MQTHSTLTSLIPLALCWFISPAALAVTVYQWTDTEGVVHFSDTPPAAPEATAVSATEILDFAGEATDPEAYSIVNQLEAMIAWRRQAEEDRRAEKQLQLEEQRLALAQAATQPAPAVREDVSYSRSFLYPAGFYYPGLLHYKRYPHRPGFRNKWQQRGGDHFGAGPGDPSFTREQHSVANPRFSRK